MKLTKSSVDRIEKPSAGQLFCWDDELKGFGVRITPTRKTYIAQSRVAGRTVRVTIGSHNPLTPEKARKLAVQRLGEMAGGVDHNLRDKKQDARSVTLNQAYEDYLEAKKSKLSANTKADYKKAMNAAFDDWKQSRIVSLNRDMIERRFDNESKKGHAQANRNFRFLRALLNFAMEKYATDGEPLIPSNPCNRLKTMNKWHRIERRTRYIEPGQMKAFFSALEHSDDDTAQRNAVRDLCALLILTGLREQEGSSLLWEDVDLAHKRITVRHTKNHRTHSLPIGNWLVRLLTARHEARTVSPFVYPANSKEGHLKYHFKDVLVLSKQSGIPFRLHDLRRTFATVVNQHLERSLSAYTIKRLLNHANGADVTAGYVQHSIDDLREPMQAVENFILRCAEKIATAPVVELANKRATANHE